MGIHHALNHGEVHYGPFFLEGYAQSTHTVYEFAGCFYHCCEHCYNTGHLNPVTKISYCVLRMLSDDWMQFRENVCPELDVVRWREGACVTQWSGGFGAELYRMEPNYCLPVGLNLYDAVHACMDRLSVITEPIMTIYVLCGVDPFQLLFETILKNTTGLSVAPEQIVGFKLI